MVSRRGFLTGMLALGAAPAIVRAESLMRLWVPPQTLITGYDLSNGLDKSCIVKALQHTDGTVEITDYVLFMHPSAEEAMRELITTGSARVIYRGEVLRHG